MSPRVLAGVKLFPFRRDAKGSVKDTGCIAGEVYNIYKANLRQYDSTEVHSVLIGYFSYPTFQRHFITFTASVF